MREHKSIDESVLRDDLKLGDKVIDNLLQQNVEKAFYFTLDHVLCKSKNPFSALSLYNLVPCCHICNSKFKTTRTLVNTPDEAKLSPTFH